MEVKTGNQDNNHFPVDRDAPLIENKSVSLKDIVFLLIIFGTTFMTVSLSLYIIFSKYF